MSDVGKNIGKALIKVRHSELSAFGDSLYKRYCPECKKGLLMVSRERKEPYRITDYDICLLCGQRFQYVDVLTMRKNENNE